MNGEEETRARVRSWRTKSPGRSSLLEPVLPAPGFFNVAGSAPPKACNDNTPARGGNAGTGASRPPGKDAPKLQGYCCDGQRQACFLYKTDTGTKEIWCRNWRRWTPTPCIDNS